MRLGRRVEVCGILFRAGEMSTLLSREFDQPGGMVLRSRKQEQSFAMDGKRVYVDYWTGPKREISQKHGRPAGD